MNNPIRQDASERSPRWRERWDRIRRLVRGAAPFAGGVIAALAALFLYNIFVPPPHPLTAGEVRHVVDQAMASATPPPAFSAMVYQEIRPSLVLIEAHSPQDDGLGSGVIVNDNGDILTSLHVVEGATSIQITFADGTQATGAISATQAQNDIAVVSPSSLPAKLVPAVLGDPGTLHEGDDAFVVGNPFGLYSSMSAGVISGFNRSFSPPDGKPALKGLIQIDAAVNPGNSGGPLLNRDGEVVGIITGIVNPTNQDVFIGIGFAVPINVAGGAAGSPPY